MSVGMGMPASTAQTLGSTSQSAAAAVAPRSRAGRPGPPDEVFPGGPHAGHGLPAPGLLHPDLQARPQPRTHIDLHLSTTPARPSPPRGEASPRKVRSVDTDLENDLLVRAEADDLGDLKALRLGEAALPDLASLGTGSAAMPSSWLSPPAAGPPGGRRPPAVRAGRPDHRHLLGRRRRLDPALQPAIPP
ncbi:MAG: hypothetical protein U0790_08925 [Isosphaeraceae bacterium]